MEKLSSDILDYDFVKMFKPIHLVQFLAGFHRVKIKHRYVTAPSLYYQMYSSLIWVLNIIALVNFEINCETNIQGISNMRLFKSCEFIIVIINAAIAFRNNFYEGTLNSQIYVKLQTIDRIVKMPGAVILNRKMFVLSAFITCIILVSWCISVTVFNLVLMRPACPSLFIVHFLTVASYMENILAALMLIFLATRLNFVNSRLEKEAKRLRGTSISLATARFHEEKEQDNSKLVVAIHDILDSWKDCIRLFQFQILSFTCQVLGADFLVMLGVVTEIRDENNDVNYILISFFIFLMGMTSICTLSFLATIISSKMRITRSICFNILSAPYTNRDNLQKNARHILMLLQTSCTFTIYDIYTLDNRLPLRIFAITATYTIILLQFATL